MHTTLEDEFGDVVSKARQGLELSASRLAAACGLTEEEIARVERYEWVPTSAGIARLATALGLRPERLQTSAAKTFFPRYPDGRPLDRLVVEMLDLGGGYRVNGYLVGCRETGRGVVIDPGSDAEEILRAIETTGLEIERILLTHGHHDHAGALSELCQATGAPALIGQADLELLGPLETKIEGSLADGEVLPVGTQSLVARAVPGHTEGSICLLHARVAFVGDVLFAGSMGRTRCLADYARLRQGVRERLLSLDRQVALMPGHGPATTVGEELEHNPFFG
jgi:glyoxylase-like metal-dependent hydrolase (beta-lactamase superfamily II)